MVCRGLITGLHVQQTCVCAPAASASLRCRGGGAIFAVIAQPESKSGAHRLAAQGICRALDKECQQDDGKAVAVRHARALQAALQHLEERLKTVGQKTKRTSALAAGGCRGRGCRCCVVSNGVQRLCGIRKAAVTDRGRGEERGECEGAWCELSSRCVVGNLCTYNTCARVCARAAQRAACLAAAAGSCAMCSTPVGSAPTRSAVPRRATRCVNRREPASLGAQLSDCSQLLLAMHARPAATRTVAHGPSRA